MRLKCVIIDIVVLGADSPTNFNGNDTTYVVLKLVGQLWDLVDDVCFDALTVLVGWHEWILTHQHAATVVCLAQLSVTLWPDWPGLQSLQKLGALKRNWKYTVSPKNVPPSSCYNFHMHDNFWQPCTEKVSSQKMLYFLASPNQCFGTTWWNSQPIGCLFHLSHVCCFADKHIKCWNHIKIIM